jgi:hypothetical protein
MQQKFMFSYFIFVRLCTRDSTLPTVMCIVLLHDTIEAASFFKENFRQRLFYETYCAKVVQLNTPCSTENTYYSK